MNRPYSVVNLLKGVLFQLMNILVQIPNFNFIPVDPNKMKALLKVKTFLLNDLVPKNKNNLDII